MKMLVAVDGSEPSGRAVRWAAEHAKGLDAQVVAVFALYEPVYAVPPAMVTIPPATPEQIEQIRTTVTNDWCAPLREAGVEYQVMIISGTPAMTIIETAKKVGADLVVAGRRGHGGFSELLLGSVSHQLAHHVGRPLVIVP